MYCAMRVAMRVKHMLLKLLEAGVRVTAVRYHGTIHDFVMLNAIAEDPAPRGAIEQASHMLNKTLLD